MLILQSLMVGFGTCALVLFYTTAVLSFVHWTNYFRFVLFEMSEREKGELARMYVTHVLIFSLVVYILENITKGV